MINLCAFRCCQRAAAYFFWNQGHRLVSRLSPGQSRPPSAISRSSCEHRRRLVCLQHNVRPGPCGAQWQTSCIVSVTQNPLESRWLGADVSLMKKLLKTGRLLSPVFTSSRPRHHVSCLVMVGCAKAHKWQPWGHSAKSLIPKPTVTRLGATNRTRAEYGAQASPQDDDSLIGVFSSSSATF